MNLGVARKVMATVNLAEGDIGIHPDDPTIYFFEAKRFLERYEVRLDVTGELVVGPGLLPEEHDLLVLIARPLVQKLVEELEGA